MSWDADDVAAAAVLGDAEEDEPVTMSLKEMPPLAHLDIGLFEGAAAAWRQAFNQANIGVDGLDVAEVHDCFTIADLLIYEAMGLAKKGQGARAIAEGWTHKDGKLPINPSGGLKSKGHPIGATGASMHVMAAMQTRGDAGPLQIDGAEVAGVFNMGGSAVVNYVSILQAIR